MNLLIDECPNFVIVEGEEYEINSDFRTSILFELSMQDGELSLEQRLDIALNLYYPVIPDDLKASIQAILWFYSCGKEEVREDDEEPPQEGQTSNKSIYSFEHDDEYIYAAYLTQYNIDLNSIDYLHWWKFKALFKSLSSTNKIIEIMNIRDTRITKDMTKEQKRNIRELQRLYKLPDNRSEEEKETEFASDFDSMF